MKNLVIAGIQFDIIWEDKNANFTKLEDAFLSKIRPGEIDCIVLPEMFATGFTMEPSQFWEDERGITFEWLRTWAKLLKTSFGAGLITKNDSGQYQNTFVMVSPDGNIEFYHKRHLFRMGSENEHYISGDNINIININGWKINLQVCYDLRFPVFARNTIVNGLPLYDALIYIANWPKVRTYAWTNLLQARAIENQSYVIGINRVGMDGKNVSHSGNSVMFGPTGKEIYQRVNNEEKLLKFELNANELVKGRKNFPVLLDSDTFKITDK